ncbi:MAG: PepSY domain-containing protein [Gammaproteobacteria bacterium]|nr:PepSY domain-containing protein [Gammaproteobacteria bacterium]
MKPQSLFRKIHYWGSLFVALPLIIMIGAGILLMVKKEVVWIQPISQKGIERTTIPTVSMPALFNAAKSVESAGFTSWGELERADFKPGKGIIKFVSNTHWEVQVDTHTGEVLQVAKRRSDVIEAIHDGTYFADWMKLGLFLPVGVVLLFLWLTGVYLFVFTEYKKAKKRKTAAIQS